MLLGVGAALWAWAEYRAAHLHGHGLGPVRWLLIVAAVALAFVPAVRRAVLAVVARVRAPSPRSLERAAVGVALAATCYFVFTAFLQDRDLFPKTHDEGSYVIGLRMLARGRLWMPQHPLADFFDTFYVLVRPVYASLYFPGTALMYAPSDWFGWPTWVLPVLAAGAVVGLLYRIVAELVDGAAAVLAALLLVSLSWYRMLSVLVFAQVPLLLLALLLVWAWLRWRRRRGMGWALAMGAFAGWAAIVRPVDALCYAIPVGIAVLRDLFLPLPPGGEGRGEGEDLGVDRRNSAKSDAKKLREAPPPDASRSPPHPNPLPQGGEGTRRLLTPLLVLLGAAPFLVLQLYFNKGVTGRFTQTPYTYYLERDQPRTAIGFHEYDPSLVPQSTLPQKRDYYASFMLDYIREHQPGTFLSAWATKFLPMLVDVALPARFLLVLVPLGVLGLTDTRRRVLWAPLPLFVAGYMLNTFFLEHYAAAVIPAMILSVLLGLYALADAWPRWRDHVLAAGVLVLVATSLMSFYEFNPAATALTPPEERHHYAIDDETFRSPTLRFAKQVEDVVDKPAVVLFKYSPGLNVIEEPVYNTDVAWPDDAPVIRAHDLGGRNGEIFRYYAEKQPERTFYRFDRATGTLTPLGRARELAARGR